VSKYSKLYYNGIECNSSNMWYYTPQQPQQNSYKKCECGADKVWGEKKCRPWMHQDYCPKYVSKEQCDKESELKKKGKR
jgi:hypothetical protein